MSGTRLQAVLLLILAAPLVTAQGPPCISKVRTTPVGGSYYATALATRDDLLVSVDYDSLTTWDITDASQPDRLGQWISVADGRSYGGHNHLEIDSRGFAYVGNWHPYSVEIFDLRDLSAPEPVTRLGRWNDFLLMDDLLVGVIGPLDVVNVSDPFHPVVVCDGCFELKGNGPPSYSGYTGLAVAGDLLVAAHFDTFWVIDLSDPAVPVEVASIVLDRYHSSNIRVWAGDDRAVIWSSISMHVVDLTEPTQPAAYRIDNDFYDPEWAQFHGRTILIGDFATDHVIGLDLTDPAEPVEIDPFAGFTDAGEITGNKLFLSSSSGLEVRDLDVYPPEVVGAVGWNRASAIVTEGDFGIVRSRSSLRSFDMEGAGGPKEKDRLVFDEYVWSIALDESTVVASLYPPALGVFTVKPNFSLQERSRIPLGECNAYSLELDDDLLVVPLNCPDGTGGIELYDLTDPSNSERLSSVVTDEPVLAAVVRGDRLFATSGGSVVELDISDPRAPVVRNSLWIADGVNRLYAIVDTGECLFAGAPAGMSAGILVAIDVSIPGDPIVLATADRGPSWLAGEDGMVSGGNYQELYLSRCPGSGDGLEVQSFEPPRSLTGGGAIQDGSLFLASRHSLDEVDLECVQPEVDFRWYRFGTLVYFEDLTTYNTTWDGLDRVWRWTFPNRTITTDRSRAVAIDFELPGVYTVSLQVITEMGSSSVTKTIELPRQPGLSPSNRQSARRVLP